MAKLKYTVYEMLHGRVLFGGTVDLPPTTTGLAQALEDVVPPGAKLLVDREYNDGWIDVITLIHYDLPESPNPEFVFNWAEKVWQDMRELADVKADAYARIDVARAAANQIGFDYGGKTFPTDALSRSDIDGVTGYVGLIGSMPSGWTGQWKAIDGTYLSIPDVATWKAFYTAMVDQGTTNVTRSETRKAAIAAATTNAEVDAIVW